MLKYAPVIALSHSNAFIRVSRNYGRSMLDYANKPKSMFHLPHLRRYDWDMLHAT